MLKIAEATKHWWQLPHRPIFHHLISLICSQEVKFAQGRKIRQAFYKFSPEGIISRQLIQSLTDDQLASTKLAKSRCKVVRKLADIPEGNIEEYQQVDGVGPWTIKGLKILAGLDQKIILFEDKWIRQRLSELVDHDKILPERVVKDIFSHWPGNESMMSYFFWRIQPSGIRKLKSGENLIRDDFV